ncbi:MAG: tail fiber domain-containing protein, partial [Patescibacteria group bacterium]|nr:tail fiber domain-containing protein [Patescibacteria group bacterium]
MGGSKGGQSTSTVQIPPEVLQNYRAVNANAQQVAQKPFQEYTGQFVAPLTQTQQAGIANTNTAATQAQPYFGAATSQLLNAQSGYQPYQDAATGLAAASAGSVNAQPLDINAYMNPYLGTVLGSTAALINQNNQQQQAGQLGNAIRSGAFGGDRAGIAAANLAQQQNLAAGNIYSGIASNAFNTALGAAQQQQGVNLGAGQANRAALLSSASALGQLGAQGYNIGASTAQNLANLGTGAQAAGLQGAQAQMAAGQAEQQTQQALDSAKYNQFLQQQSYPFQVAQFLANIAEGTGSLSGSTTTTNTVQNGIFSDKRLKTDIKPIGKTFDGQTIYSYRYKGEQHHEIGLIAQEVEKHHPEAVGLAGGHMTVDYGKATENAAHRGHFAAGGVAGYDPAMTAQLMADYQAMYGPLLNRQGGIGASGIVPAATVPVQALHPAEAQPMNLPSAADTAAGYAKAGNTIGSLGDKLGLWKYGEGDSSGSSKKGLGSLADLFSGEGSDLGFASGGIIPYDGSDNGIDIPDDQQKYKLLTPDSAKDGLGGGNGIKDTADTLGSIAGAGMAIAKFLPMIGISDARAKEDIKPVGKTFDGQTVYSYRYKGDDTPRMGLIAQEVEKHHPEAVGEARGFKTVDYSRATKDSAKRGHFASGGAPDALEAAILAKLNPWTVARERSDFTQEDGEEGTLDEPVFSGAGDEAPTKHENNFVEEDVPEPVGGGVSAAPKGVTDEEPVINTGKRGTRATRNNNPANIEAGSFAKNMPGYQGSDGRFAVFDTPEHGRDAQIALLKSYVSRGYDTPAKIANRWAPGSEKGNNPLQYAKALAAGAGIGVDDPISATAIPKIASAQARVEGWQTPRADGGRAGYATDGSVDDLEADFDASLPAKRAPTDVTPVAKSPNVDAALKVAAAKPDVETQPAPQADTLGTLQHPDSTNADVTPRHGFFKGLGHGDASSWIPLLSGIGALASTQTNNPFTAVAAGLGAGAQASAAQQQFRLDQQKANAEKLVAETGWQGLPLQRMRAVADYQSALNGTVGQMTAWLQQYQPLANALHIQGKPDATLDAQIAAMNKHIAETSGAGSAGVVAPAFSKVDLSNPAAVQQLGLAAALAGMPGAGSLVSTSQGQLGMGKQFTPQGTVQNIPGAGPAAVQAQTVSDVAKASVIEKNRINAQADAANQSLNNAKQLRSLLVGPNGDYEVLGGPLEKYRSGVGSVLMSAGIPADIANLITRTDVTNSKAADKLRNTLGAAAALGELGPSVANHPGEFNT